MAEFQENLGTPGDYQRPVKTAQQGVDIFGAAADLFRGFNQANKASAGPSPAEIRAEATAEGLDVFSAGAAAIMSDTPNGPGANVLAFFGADAKRTFDEMKKVDEAAKSGEISGTIREVQLEKLVAGVMGKYPEASYEIMGQALNAIGVDHAFGRAWKSQMAAQAAAEKNIQDAENERYKLATGLGFTGDYKWLVAKGQEVEESRRVEGAMKRYMDLRTMLDDKKIKLTEAQRKELEAQKNTLETEVLSGVKTAAALPFADILDKLSNFQRTAGADPEMNKQFISTLQTTKAGLLSTKARLSAQIASMGVDSKSTEEWFDAQIKAVDGFMEGALSNDKTLLTMHNIIRNSAAIENSAIAETYQSMVDVFGAPLIHGILEGSVVMEGVTPENLDFLRKDLIEGFSKGAYTFAEAQKKVMAAQSALSGADITKITNEKERGEVVTKAYELAKPTMAVLLKEGYTPTQQDISNFKGSTLSLATAVMEDAPTITNENLAKIVPVLFSDSYRKAAGKALEGQNSEETVKNIQFNTVVTGKLLETYQSRYLATGQVKYDQPTQRYVPVPTQSATFVGSMSAGSQVGGQGGLVVTKDQTAAAAHMNALLTHLSKVDEELVEVVSDEKLQTKETNSEGVTNYTYSTVKDVFATDEGFIKSLANFEQFRPDEKLALSIRDDFFNQTKEYNKSTLERMATTGSLFDFSQVGASSGYLKAQLDSAEITLGASMAGSTRIVPKDMKTYKMSMRQTEAGPNIKPGQPHDLTRSSASGHYGFLNQYQAQKKNPNAGPGTWDLMLFKIKPETKKMTPQQRYELMKDSAIEEAVMEAFTIENINALKDGLGQVPSWEEVNMAHLLGAGGAVPFIKALRATPFASAKSVLPDDVVRNNPELTSGTLLDLWNKRLGRVDKEYQNYMKARLGVESAPMPSNDFTSDFSEEALDEMFAAEFGR